MALSVGAEGLNSRSRVCTLSTLPLSPLSSQTFLNLFRENMKRNTWPLALLFQRKYCPHHWHQWPSLPGVLKRKRKNILKQSVLFSSSPTESSVIIVFLDSIASICCLHFFNSHPWNHGNTHAYMSHIHHTQTHSHTYISHIHHTQRHRHTHTYHIYITHRHTDTFISHIHHTQRHKDTDTHTHTTFALTLRPVGPGTCTGLPESHCDPCAPGEACWLGMWQVSCVAEISGGGT